MLLVFCFERLAYFEWSSYAELLPFFMCVQLELWRSSLLVAGKEPLFPGTCDHYCHHWRQQADEWQRGPRRGRQTIVPSEEGFKERKHSSSSDLSHNFSSSTIQLHLPLTTPLPGSELTKEPFRWDQRLFALVLRIPGNASVEPEPLGGVPSDDSAITPMCEVTGGWWLESPFPLHKQSHIQFNASYRLAVMPCSWFMGAVKVILEKKWYKKYLGL